ncbi:MAG: hypothetical protein AAFY25_04215 [Pseudomonadota bacterium]
MSDAPFEPDPLERDFRALKAHAAPPGDDLMARVLADADAVQAAAMAPPPRAASSFGTRFVRLIGGWPSLAGLATAGIAGVWIGLTQPAALIEGSQALLYGDQTMALVDLDPGFGFSDLDGGL